MHVKKQGGGWCNDIKSCVDRAATRRGSTRHMSKVEIFSGILSNNASLNPGMPNLSLLIACFHICVVVAPTSHFNCVMLLPLPC